MVLFPGSELRGGSMLPVDLFDGCASRSSLGEAGDLASLGVIGRKSNENLLTFEDSNNGMSEGTFDVRGDHSTIQKPDTIERLGANLDDAATKVLLVCHWFLSIWVLVCSFSFCGGASFWSAPRMGKFGELALDLEGFQQSGCDLLGLAHSVDSLEQTPGLVMWQ